MTGRQRTFEKDEMLKTIMCVFWRNGYAGTSMSDLTKVTGLTKPSLYLAYGNKEEMFKSSLGRYLRMQSEAIGSKLNAQNGSLKGRIGDFLKASALSATQSEFPNGCFILSASTEAHSHAMPKGIRALIDEINATALNMLTDCIAKYTDGAITHVAARKQAQYILVLQSGVMQMALRGMDYASLEEAIETAMEATNVTVRAT